MTSTIRFSKFTAVAGSSAQLGGNTLPRESRDAASASVECSLNWSALVRARRNRLANGLRPSNLEVLAWSAVRAVRLHGRIPLESLGIAGHAVVSEFQSFAAFCSARRRQQNQTIPFPQFLVACAPIINPSIPTLFLGLPKTPAGEARLTLTFPRTAMSEADAAALLSDITAGISADHLL
jgi:hypothetical protein